MGFDYSKFRNEVRAVPLNELLDQLEIDISHVGQGRLIDTQKMLVKMDEAQQRIDDMRQKGLPVKAEAAQFNYLMVSLEKSAKKVLNDLGGMKQLKLLRQQCPSGQDFQWWHLDKIYVNQWKKSLSKILIGAGVVGLLLVVISVVYDNFLKPDAAVTGKYTHQMNADQYLAQGDLTKALVEINQALDYAPSDADLFVMRGVIQTKLGNIGQANNDFNRAETALGDQVSFLLLRAQSWLTVGDYQSSLADSKKVIREDPASAEGYFYLGRANELLQNYGEAIDAYETASKLAETQGKAELNASIRISLAMLMQTIPQLVPTLEQTPVP